MSTPKDFIAGIDSDQRRSPTRVVLVPEEWLPMRRNSD